MQFNWVKFCSNRCVEILRSGVIGFAIVSVLWGIGLATEVSSWALTVQPVNGGSQSPAVNGTGTFYYLVKTDSFRGVPDGTYNAFWLSGTGLDITQTSVTDSSASTNQGANYFELQLTTTVNLNSINGQQLVVTAQAYPQTTGHPAPIAAVNGLACTLANNNCQAQGQITNATVGSNDSNGRFYAAKIYPSQAVNTVGFYVSEICSDYASVGGTATGCTGQTTLPGVTVPTAGSPTTIQLAITITTAPDSNVATQPNGSALDTTSGPITLSMQVDTQQLSCTESALLEDYTPGDSSIYFTPNGLSNTFSTACSACAPLQTLYVVGSSSGYPIVDNTFKTNSTNNVVSALVPQAFQQQVTGFTNAKSNSSPSYTLSFIMMDQAGVYAPPDPVTSCYLSGVVAVQVQGLLNKSNCFIATAAFGSGEIEPVLMLRQFRDQVLLHFDIGHSLVRWYYRWSPGAADWLIAHPIFRLPVLLVLAPLEGFAWVCLHLKVVFLGFLILGLLVSWVYWLVRSLGSRHRGSLFLLIGVLFLSTSAIAAPQIEDSGQSGSIQPHIDEIRDSLELDRSNLKMDESGVVDPYIQSQKKNLKDEAELKRGSTGTGGSSGAAGGGPSGDDSSAPESSYLEKLRASDPLLRSIDQDGKSYTDEEKQKLAPMPEGGAIQAVSEGKSELHPKKSDGSIHNAFGVRYGAALSRSVTGASNVVLRPFSSVYGQSYAPDLSFFYEFQPFHSKIFGNIGIMLMGGVAYYQGVGTLAFAPQKPDGTGSFSTVSNTNFRFFTAPAVLALTYRFNLAHYFRPFVAFGGLSLGYVEQRNDGVAGHQGHSEGIYAAGGVSVLLDWMAPQSAWDIYSEFTIRHYYLTIEYSRIMTLTGDIQANISGVTAGFTFEY